MDLTESQIKLFENLSKNMLDILTKDERRNEFQRSLNEGIYNRDTFDINNENPLESILIPLFKLFDELKLKTVDFIDLEKYSGIWYEIARLPNSFQKDISNVTAEYTLEKNRIKVVNSARRRDGTINSVSGYATAIDSTNSKLDVVFFWPFSGKYYIVKIGKDYEYSVVTEPSRKVFWILSRTKTLSQNTIDEILKEFPSNDLIFTKHD